MRDKILKVIAVMGIVLIILMIRDMDQDDTGVQVFPLWQVSATPGPPVVDINDVE